MDVTGNLALVLGVGNEASLKALILLVQALVIRPPLNRGA